MKILIVIPAFNEEKNLSSVIKDLRTHHFDDILVINDGSADTTLAEAKKNKVKVVSHLLNRGLGAALGTGFNYARNNQYDILITFDADSQHQASDLKNLIEPIASNKVDVVIGSRLLHREQMPLYRQVLNLLSNIATYSFYGVWTTDSLSGLRAFNKKAIRAIRLKTDRMEVSNEFFKEIGLHRLRYQEIPIKAIYSRDSLENSKQESFAPLKLGLRILFRLFR